MKFALCVFPVIWMAFGSPVDHVARDNVLKRQNTAATDEILFSISLSAFTARRDARNPPDLDWSSDNCSWSPDNPFGFPFEVACQRHDFGYRNYKHQGRFNDSSKLRIDNNFRNDLYTICASESFRSACEATADVYYLAVRAFGRTAGSDFNVALLDPESLRAYASALDSLRRMAAEAKLAGKL